LYNFQAERSLYPDVRGRQKGKRAVSHRLSGRTLDYPAAAITANQIAGLEPPTLAVARVEAFVRDTISALVAHWRIGTILS